MLTEGKVRAIAASVAAALIKKVKPDVSDEQIKSAVEDVVRQLNDSGELTGGTVSVEQIASAVEAYLLEHPIEIPDVAESAEQAKNAAEAAEAAKTAAVGSATTASNAATAAQTAQGKAETAKKAAEDARDAAAQKASDATNAAQTATTAATGAAEAKSSAEKAASAASTHAENAEGAASRAEALAKKVEDGELKGDPGKSAYQHAQEGGFEGTEEAFNAKLATPFPSTLPNPKSLIINGVVYDGSKQVTMQLDDAKLAASVDELPAASEKYEDIYYAVKGETDADGRETGDIYWCIEKFGHTNYLPTATFAETDTTAFTCPYSVTFENGYAVGLRLSGGSGKPAYDDVPTASVTGFIPAKPGDVVRIRNIVLDDVNSANGGLVMFFDKDKNIFCRKHIGYFNNSTTIVKEDNGDYHFTVPSLPNTQNTTSGMTDITAYAPVTYIRIQFSVTTPDPSKGIVTVNETIKDYDSGWYWEDSGIDKSLGNDTALLKLTKRVNVLEEGKAVEGGYSLPDYWNEHLDNKIATINGYLADGGRNTFAYVVMTDLHIAEQRASYTGKIARRIMDECGIKTALDLGDHTSRGYIADRATSDAQFDSCRDLVKPIADDILPTQGNHDGTIQKSDGTTEYYAPTDALDQVYGGMRTDMPIVWDEHGSGYYADDRSHRVRYIMLNTCARGEFAGDLASNGGYSYFRYTQSQYEMVKDALSTLPNDRWRVVVASHVPPVASVDRFGDGLSVSNIKNRFSDAPEMRKLLAAYVNRESANISYTDTSFPYGSASLTADFSNAKGRLVAYHSGHFHVDLLWAIGSTCDSDVGDALTFPILGHRCDSFNENQDSGSTIEAALEAERVVGTITEHSFDVVVVDPDSDTMHLVKIGAGQDRSVSLRR